ncbi:hypothetical protein GCM10010211_49980 [Streptomyces albospinus]|uniref:Uncharacterized protein n=1 Tax=Streptomyces albospinus TaxID=285515 RepID=A0ABQ2VCE7_9ACTN|nr:hypothetical protein GCM10010211_49980 [Streptomyces albospinus]
MGLRVPGAEGVIHSPAGNRSETEDCAYAGDHRRRAPRGRNDASPERRGITEDCWNRRNCRKNCWKCRKHWRLLEGDGHAGLTGRAA